MPQFPTQYDPKSTAVDADNALIADSEDSNKIKHMALSVIKSFVLAVFGSNGIIARTAAGTFASRTITGTSNQVNVSNGDGVSGNPTLSLPQSIATSSTPQFAGIEVGNASDTTLSRSAAGKLAVEGIDIPTVSSTDTLTNKTLTSPTLNSPSVNTAIYLPPLIQIYGSSSGYTQLSVNAVASGVMTLPAATDTLVGRATTDTLTNKRITKRVGTTTSSGTPTINTDNVDVYIITAQAAAITSFTTNLSGTPTDGQSLIISITDNGTARAITWGSSFESSTVSLPTTTVTSARLDVGFIWNAATSKWRCIGVA